MRNEFIETANVNKFNQICQDSRIRQALWGHRLRW